MTAVIPASGECGDADGVSTPTPSIVKLRDVPNSLSTAERLQQTLDYVKGPEQYLRQRLGDVAFNARKHLLSLAPSYEKDVYGSGGHKTYFQQRIAQVIGKKYGIFFVTGVQAQLVALKIHCDEKHNQRVAWHVSSHLESAEECAYRELYGLNRSLLGKDAHQLPSVEEIIAVIEQDTPAVVLLELPNRTLGCATYTYHELERIAKACREHEVLLHLDGARLWEVMPYYERDGRQFEDISALFDSVYVSFYKGLGGITGAMLLTNDQNVYSQAQMWQRRAGGNPFTLMYETIDCERGYNENIGTFDNKWQTMIELVKAIEEATTSYHNPHGEKILSFGESQPTCCQVKTVFNGYTSTELYLARDRVQSKHSIRIFDSLWPKITLDDKLAADRAGNTPEPVGYNDNRRHELEWMVVDSTLNTDKAVFVQGYVALCQELQAIKP